MIRATVRVDTDIFDALVQAAENAPKAVEKFVRGSVAFELSDRLFQRFPTPGKPKYPLRWASDRQRRAYFATDGFGAGIPYRRTDNIIDQTEVVYRKTGGGGQLEVVNHASYAQYVIGDQQQPFHRDTGWPLLSDLATDLTDDAADLLIEGWYSIVELPKGVKLE